uniref:Putative ABC-type transport system, periplasmic component n=1 Tax=mine drainage metagenome TaxID=410659 RepID=E6PF18_9ZZZZ
MGLLPTQGAAAVPSLRIAYAGSMGAVMDRGLGPRFARSAHLNYQGIGAGAYGLARLIAAGRLQADLFISITPGPIRILQRAGLVARAVPIARTQMVIAYSPKSRFAAQFQAAARGDTAWWRVLETPGLRFGRTDPATDPQGQSIIFTMQLAQNYYHRPDLSQRILGTERNPAQIFTEASLLSRLESGEIDASSGYESAVRSLHLPFIALPPQIDLGDPAYARSYERATIRSTVHGKLKTLHPQPLVFYAAVLKGATNPKAARAFIEYARSDSGQQVLRAYGYDPPLGSPL